MIGEAQAGCGTDCRVPGDRRLVIDEIAVCDVTTSSSSSSADHTGSNWAPKRGRFSSKDGQHDAHQAGLFGPPNLRDGRVDVVEGGDGEPEEPLRCGVAEVDQPAVVRAVGCLDLFGRAAVAEDRGEQRWMELEGKPEVGEDDLAGNAFVVQLFEPLLRIPLAGDPALVEHRLHPQRHKIGVDPVGEALGVGSRHAFGVEPVAERVELLADARIEIGAVLAHLRGGMPVRGNHQGAFGR